MNKDLFGNPVVDKARDMSSFFGVAPFSILNTCEGDWQGRKRKWNSLIGDNGQARQNVLGEEGSLIASINGTSILDPVLAELMIKWFTNEGFKSFDPFAGDTVFGFVSGYLKRPFTGIELRQEQVDFNQKQCDDKNLFCKYICSSSEHMDRFIPDLSMDFVFSCPPYADLEVYSDLKDDLSTMSYTDFFVMYRKILQNTYTKLRLNRFACIVIGEVRDKNGVNIGLVPKTIEIMTEAGYKYYNEMILVNSVGTLPMRAGKQMNSGRKIGKRHQNVLVFYKGTISKIKENFPEIIPKNQYYN